MNFLPWLTLLLVAQMAGTVIQKFFHLPVPGAVIGMVLVFCGLVARKQVPEALAQTSTALLRYLPLLFIPAGVGVMQQWPVLRAEWLPIGVTLVVSCFLTLAFTGLVMQLLLRRGRHKNQQPEEHRHE